jgi:hypothetical protein
MKFTNSDYSKKLHHSKLSLSFGEFYLFETFFISEIYEGVHFDWDKVEDLIMNLIDFYGEDIKLGYISNRVNSYSIDPYTWVKIENTYDFIVASAIVSYNHISLMNTKIEKLFSKKSIKACDSLEEAIKWIRNLKEFN